MPTVDRVQTAVEIHGLSKRFGRVQAVTGLDLTVTGGRVTGFLGPNGAGKSTTLRVLLGLIIGATIGLFLTPTAGANPTDPLSFLKSLPLLTAAFLAGYAVEIFFALLDKVVNDARAYIAGKNPDPTQVGK